MSPWYLGKYTIRNITYEKFLPKRDSHHQLHKKFTKRLDDLNGFLLWRSKKIMDFGFSYIFRIASNFFGNLLVFFLNVKKFEIIIGFFVIFEWNGYGLVLELRLKFVYYHIDAFTWYLAHFVFIISMKLGYLIDSKHQIFLKLVHSRLCLSTILLKISVRIRIV